MLWALDYAGARDRLERAAEADPHHPAIHAAFADAWSGLGYDGNAAREAKKAFEFSRNLSREDRLDIEGRYREMTSEWDKAIEIYRSLWQPLRDDAAYGLRLANAQTEADKPKEALTTIEALRALPPPARGDPRIDLEEASAAASLFDAQRQKAAAARAVEKGKALGARSVVAEARLHEGWALTVLGERQRARDAFESARQVFAELKNRGGIADAVSGVGDLLHQQGDLTGAQRK